MASPASDAGHLTLRSRSSFPLSIYRFSFSISLSLSRFNYFQALARRVQRGLLGQRLPSVCDSSGGTPRGQQLHVCVCVAAVGRSSGALLWMRQQGRAVATLDSSGSGSGCVCARRRSFRPHLGQRPIRQRVVEAHIPLKAKSQLVSWLLAMVISTN